MKPFSQMTTEMTTPAPIHYINGDATNPVADEPAIIAHICNDVGAWGAGFVRALSKRWKKPEQQFRLWFRGHLANAPPFALGNVLFVPVDEEVLVANMIAQHGIGRHASEPPIRYDAVNHALGVVAEEALRLGASVHMPRIGCGLAGGTWDRIQPLIETQLSQLGVRVSVYDFAN
jgi:O-acetyl-ADP-ribose deacetylase (regulator of RNase III)